ncbi:MAG: transcriptional repressor [Clostridia bacterium]|nr:transcriptional repressor [Clostridia bacterium]
MKQTRNTQQKRLVKELMENNRTHPTADELYELARLRDPHISRGTVYRDLKALDAAGVLRRLSMPTGPDHYDSRMDDHYHFLCRGCNRVADTELPYNEELNAVSPGLPGYQVEWHRLILVGLCPKCAKKQQEEEK